MGRSKYHIYSDTQFELLLTWNASLQRDKLGSKTRFASPSPTWSSARGKKLLYSHAVLLNECVIIPLFSINLTVRVFALRWKVFLGQNRCLFGAQCTTGGQHTGPRRLVCPGCGIIFCKCAEMPFLLHWLWMQETATGSMCPVESKTKKITALKSLMVNMKPKIGEHGHTSIFRWHNFCP